MKRPAQQNASRARLILAHRERDKIAIGFDEIGWESSCDALKKHISPNEWLDWRLVKNIKDSGKHPALPEVKHPRFPYNQMNNQVCQQIAFNDVVCCHNMAIGSKRFDIIFYVRMIDGLSQIIINIEAQKDEPKRYKILNRAIFYVCRMISSCIGRKSL